MSMLKLAVSNFKSSFRNYFSLVMSLSFTILVLLNFQNILYSDGFELLGTRNREYVDLLVKMVSVVLVCFLFFFVWYASNVFLTKRKKEIGIYVFMGLSNETIGRLYLYEMMFTGLSALVLGLASGTLTTGLFQMVLLAISEIAVDIEFQVALRPILTTMGIYLVVYTLFMLRGYWSITRSSVLDMLSAARQNEYVRQKNSTLLLKAVLGAGLLGSGYYLAIKRGGAEIMGNVFLAMILVIAGVYFLFGGLIPLLFQGIAGQKNFLYQKERCLWINQIIFRMRKNYRTYAMVCVLMICSVTALATGFAMRERYHNLIHFDQTYTFQILSRRSGLEKEIEQCIEENDGIAYSSQAPLLCLDSGLVSASENYSQYALISWSSLKKISEDTGMECSWKEPERDEVIHAANQTLLSLITELSDRTIVMNGKVYRQIEETTIPYLGYLQRLTSFYVVNDEEFERLLPLGHLMYTYNYRTERPGAFEATKAALDSFMEELNEETAGRVAVDPNSNELDWVKVFYSLCIFMFLVFILASGSIMFMKSYNDAFEERERYDVLKKMGVDISCLKRAVAREQGSAYGLPLLVMGISSWFSVCSLGRMMQTSLFSIWIVSVLVALVVFVIFCRLSIAAWLGNAGLQKNSEKY